MLTHCGTQAIHTARLLLRQFQHADAQDMLNNWVANPAIQSMISEPVYTTKHEVQELLNTYIASYDSSSYYRWAIVEKDSQSCIGQIAIFLVDSKNHFCEIEYALGSAFHRKGYATEAVRAILSYCFSKLSFHKVQVCHKENNVASQGVIKKSGFTYEGTLRDYFYMDGKYVSRLYYSMLRSEYNG